MSLLCNHPIVLVKTIQERKKIKNTKKQKGEDDDEDEDPNKLVNEDDEWILNTIQSIEGMYLEKFLEFSNIFNIRLGKY